MKLNCSYIEYYSEQVYWPIMIHCLKWVRTRHRKFDSMKTKHEVKIWQIQIVKIDWIFIGGDDVQQLCDAGEDEFLEIMALVGMASKPLHVRRFQKSLAEWVSNPASFKVPLSSIDSTPVEFSPEPVTQSRSPFHPIPTYSPSSISGAATMGSTFSTIGSISSNIGSSLGQASGTPTSSIQLTPTLSDDQVIRLTRAAER